MHRGTKNIERAYIGFDVGDGGQFGRLDESTFNVRAQFGAVNRGQTPAEVTDAILNIELFRPEDRLPVSPQYRRERVGPAAFLVPGALVTFGTNLDLTANERQAIHEERLLVYVIGYVDYI